MPKPTNPPTVAGVSEPSIPERPTLYASLWYDPRESEWKINRLGSRADWASESTMPGAVIVTIPGSTSPPQLPQPAPEPKVEPAREGREWEKRCKWTRGQHGGWWMLSPTGAYWLSNSRKWTSVKGYAPYLERDDESLYTTTLSRAPTPPDATDHVPGVGKMVAEGADKGEDAREVKSDILRFAAKLLHASDCACKNDLPLPCDCGVEVRLR